MNNRILITYATRTGSTAEVAEAIGEVLASRGFVVDIKPMKEKPSLDRYNAVVLGSAIRLGSWVTEALDFIKENQARLNQIPTAIFTVHMLNTGDNESSRAARQAYINPVRQLITPEAEAFFAGNLDLAKLSFVDRVITKLVAAETGPKVGDFREWEKIRDWAHKVLE